MEKNDFYTSDVPKETLDARNKHIEERWEQLYYVSTQASNEVLKYLFYVSAGGAGAVLGFMGSSETARNLVGAKIALICYGIGLVFVGVVRVIIVHRTKFFFGKWTEDVAKYYAVKVGYNEIVDFDTKRTKSDVWEFIFGYVSAIACLLGLVFGGFALFS